MGKKITLGTAITLIIIAVAITVSLTMVLALRNFNEKVSGITERENMFAKFTEIDNYVRQNRSAGTPFPACFLSRRRRRCLGAKPAKNICGTAASFPAKRAAAATAESAAAAVEHAKNLAETA